MREKITKKTNNLFFFRFIGKKILKLFELNIEKLFLSGLIESLIKNINHFKYIQHIFKVSLAFFSEL